VALQGVLGGTGQDTPSVHNTRSLKVWIWDWRCGSSFVSDYEEPYEADGAIARLCKGDGMHLRRLRNAAS
jgi:hypothetical protein